MSLITMDFNFNKLGEVAQCESMSFTRSYYGVGGFEATVDPRAANALTLQPERVVFLSESPSQMYLIEEMTLTRKRLTARGTMLKGLAKRRVCVPPLTLPARLWRYDGAAWQEETDGAAIRAAMTGGQVVQGFVKPESPAAGTLFLDMTELATVYDWGADMGLGDVASDLGVAQLRSKYQNFGWDRFTGSAESAYLHYAGGNLIAPQDDARAMPGLVAAQDLERGAVLPWQARFDKLDALFGQIGEATEVGWDITPDFENERFVFGAWQGRDLTGGTVAVISEKMGNASEVQLKRSLTGSANAAYVGGAGEDENRLILCVSGEHEGTERRETWAEAGSIDDAELLRLYGRDKLEAAADKTTLTATLIDSGACRCGRDYDVGDKVLVLDAFGSSVAARITELKQTYENGKRTLAATFGDATASLGTVLKRGGGAAR